MEALLLWDFREQLILNLTSKSRSFTNLRPACMHIGIGTVGLGELAIYSPQPNPSPPWYFLLWVYLGYNVTMYSQFLDLQHGFRHWLASFKLGIILRTPLFWTNNGLSSNLRASNFFAAKVVEVCRHLWSGPLKLVIVMSMVTRFQYPMLQLRNLVT